MVQDHAEEFADALLADLGRPKMETTFAESAVIVERCIICAEKLEEWTAAESIKVPDWQQSWMPTVHQNPKGTVLIIAYVPFSFSILRFSI